MLGVPETDLEVRVLRQAKRGFFTSTPCKIQASFSVERPAARMAEAGPSRFIKKLNMHAETALSDAPNIASVQRNETDDAGRKEVSGISEQAEQILDLPKGERSLVLHH